MFLGSWVEVGMGVCLPNCHDQCRRRVLSVACACRLPRPGGRPGSWLSDKLFGERRPLISSLGEKDLTPSDPLEFSYLDPVLTSSLELPRDFKLSVQVHPRCSFAG
jgi:hypothetical protein